MLKKFFQNAAKPQGVCGKIVAMMMNYGPHAALAEWGLKHLRLDSAAKVLDVGCGGGGNIARLLALCPEGHIVGVDYSEVSVKQSCSHNANEILSGRCEIILANVAALPLPNNEFDVVTAFETIYFWPGLEACFREIYRVMRPGGVFLVCNESTGRDEMIEKFSKIIDGLTPYTEEDIVGFMRGAGFTHTISKSKEGKDWLLIIGKKEN